ncbi:alpha/beta hydrolase [Flavobacterium sp.]|uniref:alpha/beta hydrolase n=1 Tax=Flavobacterium sp. TaxID=239 RepID=UPI0039E2DDDD
MRKLLNGLLLVFLSFSLVMQAQSTASAQVSIFTIEAPQLNAPKKIWMYLPKGYATSSQKYPVLYMHDAQNLFDARTSFVGEWNVDETLDSLNAKVIVVGIEHGNDKRIDELTPYKNEKYGGGKADAYLDFIVNTLKPEIDKRYRTKTDTQNTAIMGSSLGGLVSFYAVLKYPKVFGKAGIFSPSFWYSKDIYQLAQQAPMIKAKLYFLCGDDEDAEMVSDMQRMELIVSENQRHSKKLFRSEVIKGGKHNEKLWREHFAKAYLWLMN